MTIGTSQNGTVGAKAPGSRWPTTFGRSMTTKARSGSFGEEDHDEDAPEAMAKDAPATAPPPEEPQPAPQPARRDDDDAASEAGPPARRVAFVLRSVCGLQPKEIELVLDEIDGVIESAVIGVPDADFGEQVVAVLVCQAAPLGDADIRPALDAALARFKHPRRIEVIDALPRNAMGKVQKGVLRKRYMSADAG